MALPLLTYELCYCFPITSELCQLRNRLCISTVDVVAQWKQRQETVLCKSEEDGRGAVAAADNSLFWTQTQQALDYSTESNTRSRFDYRVVYIDILICHFLLPAKEIKIFCLLYLVLGKTALKRERSSCCHKTSSRIVFSRYDIFRWSSYRL